MTPEYQDLLERIAMMEPKNGFTSASQITLTDADVAIVIAHDPDVIGDCLTTTEWAKSMAKWAYSAKCADEREGRLGLLLSTCLAVEAKTLVFNDVQEECERRELLAQSVRQLKGGVLSAVDREAFRAARGE